MYFVETNIALFVIQLLTFAKGLVTEGTSLGFSKAEIDEAMADALYLEWIVKCVDIADKYEREWVEFSKLARKGVGTVANMTAPVAPTFDAAPPVVAPGIQQRFTEKAAKAKVNPNCTLDIQKRLGIETVKSTVVHDTPDLKLNYSADFVEISFHRYGHQSINLYKNVDGKGYGVKPYMTLHKSPFIDKEMPASGVTALIKYKAIYVDADEEIGNFSPEVSITVVGR